MSEYLLPACAGSVACVILLVMLLRREYRPHVIKAPRGKKGEIVGLKVLVWSKAYQCWKSPQWNTPWLDGWIRADQPPTPDNYSGIYIGKTLESVWEYLQTPGAKLFWVRAEFPVIEHEDGYRAAGAAIIQEA